MIFTEDIKRIFGRKTLAESIDNHPEKIRLSSIGRMVERMKSLDKERKDDTMEKKQRS